MTTVRQGSARGNCILSSRLRLWSHHIYCYTSCIWQVILSMYIIYINCVDQGTSYHFMIIYQFIMIYHFSINLFIKCDTYQHVILKTIFLTFGLLNALQMVYKSISSYQHVFYYLFSYDSIIKCFINDISFITTIELNGFTSFITTVYTQIKHVKLTNYF